MGWSGLLPPPRLLRRGLVGLWLVAAVPHFNCTYDFFSRCSACPSASAVTGVIVGRGCLSCFFFATGEVAGPRIGFLRARRSRLRRRQCKASSRRRYSFLLLAQRSVSLCRRCLHRGHSGSLFARSGRRMCFPFAAAVALSTLSLRTFRSKGDLVASLPHVALFLFSAGQNPESVS